VRGRAGMEVYRIEAGNLVETWLMVEPLGSVWERWCCDQFSPPKNGGGKTTSLQK
jgi:hypothetical protein